MSPNDPKRTSNPLVSGSLQSFLDTPDQVMNIVWLAQEAYRPSLHRACPSAVVRIARDKNDGYAMPLGDETVLQIKPAQAWHVQISDETRCVVLLLGLEKFLCRTKRGSAVAQRSHERCECVARAL